MPLPSFAYRLFVAHPLNLLPFSYKFYQANLNNLLLKPYKKKVLIFQIVHPRCLKPATRLNGASQQYEHVFIISITCSKRIIWRRDPNDKDLKNNIE